MKPLSIILAIILFLMSLLSCSKSDSVDTRSSLEQQYLSFQFFSSASTEPTEDYGSLAPLATKEQLDDFMHSLVSTVGKTGLSHKKLGVMIGPLALDHSDEEITRIIDDAFELALKHDLAVGFHLDDGMFWGGREDLWSDPENIEWSDWDATLSQSRFVDWVQNRLAPHMCFNAPKVQEAMQAFLSVVATATKKGILTLEEHNKTALYSGIIVGWETSLDKDRDSGLPLGYHALHNKGYTETNPQVNLDDAFAEVVTEYIEGMALGLSDQGLPREKIYCHIAFASKTIYEEGRSSNPNFTDSYLAVNNFVVPETILNPNFNAGFTTYPQRGLFEQLYQLNGGNLTGWIGAEGTNMELAMPPKPSGFDMESYLAKHYNYGATMVNLFSFGLKGDAFVNALNDETESEQAIKAYRKFLEGKTLKE